MTASPAKEIVVLESGSRLVVRLSYRSAAVVMHAGPLAKAGGFVIAAFVPGIVGLGFGRGGVGPTLIAVGSALASLAAGQFARRTYIALTDFLMSCMIAGEPGAISIRLRWMWSDVADRRVLTPDAEIGVGERSDGSLRGWAGVWLDEVGDGAGFRWVGGPLAVDAAVWLASALSEATGAAYVTAGEWSGDDGSPPDSAPTIPA